MDSPMERPAATTLLGGPDDEDGVRFVSGLIPGTTAQVEITATASGRVDAWVDFGQT